ncbi:hypothetical protein EC957_003351 [Mortierella hygrophila]|uniref:Uncharacterized protein n=1 Tax=Mortierella hygrophila TaxID=979708 RepID=A0A9P6F2T9_9FUNG|nr:hypothetical protein EC957_003351 [Mortierella hygrophila]
MYQRPAVTQRISYVLRKDENRNAHLLGVNALALDTTTLTASPEPTGHNHHEHHHHHSSKHKLPGGILYTGGRDGMIAAWDLHFESPLARNIPGEGPENPKGLPPSTFRQSFNHHTDWVNDIVLCHNGESLVSASSDRTVKLVRPHSHNPASAHIIGTHEDYVKTLAYASGPGWVASGGLDKTVRLWDIKEGRSGQFGSLGSIPETSSKASIYALACNPAGTVLATGSPEKIIRVWDPRSGQRITKFAGHTDNIRALLISESGDTILSASSDTTIKLWSLTAQRCITTYTMHSDSVWSLYSDHPQLSTFYGGSKDGLVTKTEINRYDDEDPGQCVVICKAETGVARLVAHDNARIWTATSSSSIYQWPDIPPRISRSTELAAAIVPANLLKMSLNESSFTESSAPEQYYPTSTVYSAASLGSIYVNSRGDKQSQHSSEDDEGLIAPIFEDPENVIQGEHGLIKHTVLNNRRMVVTEDKCGEIALWDLIKCVQLETFTGRKMEDVVNELNTIESVPSWCTIDTRIGALTVHLDEGRCFDAEVYVDEIEETPDPERPDDQRIVIGKWVLNNLFEQYVPVHIDAYEKEIYRQQHQEELAAQLAVPTTVVTNEKNEVVNGQNNGNGEDAGSSGADQLNGSRPTVNTSAEGLKGPSTDPHQAGSSSPSVTAPPPTSAVGAKLNAPGSLTASPSVPSTPLSSFSPTSSSSSLNSGFMGRLKHSVKKLARTPSAEQRFENGRPVASRKAGVNPSTINVPVANAPPTSTVFKPLNSPSVPEIPAQYQAAIAGNNTNAASTAPPSASSSPRTTIVEGPGGLGLGLTGKTEGGDDVSVSISDTTSSHSIDSIPSPVLQLPSSTLSVRPPHPPFSPPTHLDFPKTIIPSHIPVIISEQSREASSTVDLYRGSVGTLAQDYIPLVQVVPTWLLEVVLKNSIPAKESPKVAFVLRPHHHQEGTTTAIVGNAAVGGELGGLLPRLGELPGGNARLTAPRMLRVRKVLAHVVEKLALVPPKRRIEAYSATATTAQQQLAESDSNTTTAIQENGPADSTSRALEPVQEEDDGPRNDKDATEASTEAEGDTQAPQVPQAPPKTKEQEEEEEAMRQDVLRPENWLEILCHEQVLSPTMTLATIRTHYWKTGSDVVLSYRYKQRGAGAASSVTASHPATLSPSSAASFSSSS